MTRKRYPVAVKERRREIGKSGAGVVVLRRVAVGFALVGIAVAATAGASWSPLNNSAETDAADALMEQLRTYRSSQGLPFDDKSIARAAPYADATMKYGVPVTPEERVLMDARIALRKQFAPVYEILVARRSEFGEGWIDPDGTVIVQVAPRGNVAEVEQLLAEARIPRDVYRIDRVKHSSAELAQAGLDFMTIEAPRLAKRGWDVTGVGPNHERNLLQVSIANLTNKMRTELERRYPGTLFVEGEFPQLYDNHR